MGYISGMLRIPKLTHLVFALLVLSSTSCVPLALGAAAGYVARENGYKVQPPLKKSESSARTDDGKSEN